MGGGKGVIGKFTRKINSKNRYYTLFPYRASFLKNIEVVTLVCFVLAGFLPAVLFNKSLIENGMLIAIGFNLCAIGCYYLRYFYPSALLFTISVFIVCFSILLQGEHPLYMWFATVPMLSIFLLPLKDAVVFVVLFVLGFLYVGSIYHKHSLRTLIYYFTNLGVFIYVFSVASYILKRIIEENFLNIIEVSVKDPLTGAFNRYGISDFIKDEIEKAKRYDYPISVIMLDINDFKKVNDTFGHCKGDEVLRRVSEVVMKNIRTCDKFVRWGGEEFIIVCPHVDLRKALKIAEKLRKCIEDCDCGGVRVTASFGVAEIDISKEFDEAIKRADDALYLSKRKGKNRVSAYLSSDIT